MRPADDIHKMIKKMHIKTSAELDKKVHNDISNALTEPAHKELNIMPYITKASITKLAVAAAILIAFGIGFFTGRWSKPASPAPYSVNVTDYTSAVSMYPNTQKAEDSFWRQKAITAMQPRPYAQSQAVKTSLLNAYKQYLKEKHYD